ncbi:uncharacterized protein LOC144552000 isoform X1 [Carex rostrata]
MELSLEDMMEDEMFFSSAVDVLISDMLEDASAALHTRRIQNDRPFSGLYCVNGILNGHPVQCYNSYRMSTTNFHVLCQRISDKLNTSRSTIQEQLAIFLDCIGHGESMGKMGEYYQHSIESIHRIFKDVLKAILSLHNDYIKLPDASADVHTFVGPNSQNYLFKDALGAIDGTHIPAIVKRKNRERHRNRKGTLSQNVLAACSFDMLFVYFAVGWEGSASDMKVFRWAMEYYLTDSGYANTSKFICPYRNHQYHLAQFSRQNRSSRYAVPEDLYNHRHAQLRNVIERTFGVLKMRFKIL